MMMVKTSVKFSPIHGLGCYAEEDIKAGDVVWKMDPTLDIVLDAEAIKSYPPSVVDFLQMYAYGQDEAGKKSYILCCDHARHMNHSENPNCIEAGDGNAFNLAARDIKIGEELTCDYNAFDTDAKFKLHHNQ
jgi:SET domain-containing protein